MATVDYGRFQTRAKTLLNKFGRDMQVVVYTKEHDPVAGNDTTAITSTSTVKGVELPASESLRQMFQSKLSEELVQSSAQYLIISAQDVAFEVKAGSLIFKGTDAKYYEVKGTTPLRPDGETTIIYWLMIVPAAISVAALDTLEWATIEELNTAIEDIIVL